MSDLHQHLRQQLVERQRANPRFSLRRLAEQLEMSPAHLSLFLAGKKGMSARKLRRVSELLPLPDTALADYLRRGGAAAAAPSQRRRALRSDEFTVLDGWHFFAILSLARTHRNSANPRAVAKLLGIPVGEARAAIGWMRERGILSTEGGKLRQLSPPLGTEVDVPNERVRAYHRSVLRLAEGKLEATSVAEREYGAITFALDERRLPALKRKIRSLLEEAADLAETPASSRVYTLSVQLFPLTPNQEKSP